MVKAVRSGSNGPVRPGRLVFSGCLWVPAFLFLIQCLTVARGGLFPFPIMGKGEHVVINVILRLGPQRWVFTGCGGPREYVIRDDK